MWDNDRHILSEQETKQWVKIEEKKTFNSKSNPIESEYKKTVQI